MKAFIMCKIYVLGTQNTSLWTASIDESSSYVYEKHRKNAFHSLHGGFDGKG